MKYIVTLFCLITSVSLFSQEQEADLIQWKTMQQADSLQTQGDKRLIFADVYADWCGPCKLMDKNTFKNSEVAKFINEYFIPVKLNAEKKQDITFKGKNYEWVSAGRNGIQSLAYVILGGQLRYPSMPIIDHNGQTLTVISGYFQPDEFMKVLNELKDKIEEYLAQEVTQK